MSHAKVPFLGRLRAAVGLVLKGNPFPFNRVNLEAAGTPGEKFNRPFAQSTWVQRAIKHISGPISAVPLVFSTDSRGGEQVYTDPKLAAWWKRPAKGLTFPQFVSATVGWRKLAGEAFWLLGDDALVPFPEVRDVSRMSPLIVARPDRMRHVVKGGELIGWEYTDGTGARHALLPEQVIQLKQWNPYDDWRGLSDFESAKIAAETSYLSGAFARNLMRGNGDRGPYIVAKNGVVEDGQREQIIADLRAKRAAASRGEFRPVFLTGDITVEDPSIQGLDTAVLNQRIADAEEVFVAFGVPPSMTKAVASYSIGSASDRFRLIEETCQPEGEEIASAIETVLARQTGQTLYAWFSWDDHSVMQQVRRERIDAAVKLWGLGVPLQIVNDNLRLGLREVPGWEIGYLPFSVAPVSSLPPEQDPSLAEPAAAVGDEERGEDAVGAMLRLLRARKPRCTQAAAAPACACGLTEPTTAAQKARDPRETARWRELMAKRRASVKAYESRFNRELMRARAETLARLDRYTLARALQQKAAAIDLVFDREAWKRGLLAALRKVSEAALHTAGKQLFEEIGKDDPFALPPEKVLEFVRGRENRLGDVADAVFERVKETLEEGLLAGDTTEQLAERVRAEFNGISRERSLTIAQTETSAAYGYSRAAAMKQAGVQYKQWLTSGNDNVRPAHLEANGQTVPVDEPFFVDGEELMYPGDPSGSPGNVINCHCVAIAGETPPEENA